MKLVILVSFLLFLPMFSSGLVENSHLDNAHYKVEEVVTDEGRIDLEMDYVKPHPRPARPPIPSDPIPPRKITRPNEN
ncbi:uncharacterized protein LOC112083415 [Eutrema salsugineum]|uniref:uncharacterized protein LOC112083415 n=1 Tax=Eutrema salsugineum TaxID=72664 RepID=UPI000CECF18E|nr:uncharacterized protein LOC112083415 [Eutrema salsugineum]